MAVDDINCQQRPPSLVWLPKLNGQKEQINFLDALCV